MTNSTPTPADALIAALHEPGREQLLDLVQNPLRLTLLCMIWDGSSLPDTQAELYERYLRKIYEWNRNLHELEKYAERCGTTTTKLKHTLNRQLGELAKAALNLPQERFRLSQALVEEHLGEESDQTSLGYLALRLGWLNRVGRDGRGDSIFAFYHATFQEYFAALAVEDWDYFLPRNHVDFPVAGKEYRIFEKQWKPVILCWLGRGDVKGEEKEEFIRALVEFEDGCENFYGYRAYFLASAGISDFKKCTFADEIVQQIITWSFGYFNPEEQNWFTFLAPLEQEARVTILQMCHAIVVDSLVELLDHTQDKSRRMLVAASLVQIDPTNQDALIALFEQINPATDIDKCKGEKYSIEQINTVLNTAIYTLANLIKDDESILKQIDMALANLSHSAPNEFTTMQALKILEKFGIADEANITALIKLISTTEDNSIRRQAAEILQKVLSKRDSDQGLKLNLDLNKAIATAIMCIIFLVVREQQYTGSIRHKVQRVAHSTRDTWLQLVSEEFSKSSFNNRFKPVSISSSSEGIPIVFVKRFSSFKIKNNLTLKEWKLLFKQLCLKTFIESEVSLPSKIYQDVSIKLEKNFSKALYEVIKEDIATNNQALFGVLEQIFRKFNLKYQQRQQANEQIAALVITLKNNLSAESYQNNFEQFEKCYEVIWTCAENLPYPDFYQAWHNPPTTPHPEVEDNTPATPTPFTQQCNLALLPQILNQALQTHPVNHQPICIDGSRFSDPSNPALQIYTTLKKAGCPPSPDGKPRTIAELQAYCDDDLSDHQIALILYEEPTDPPPQGFDITVLNQLARFSHPPIAVILPQPLPECRLPQFLEHNPNLITTLLQWLQHLKT